MKVLEINTVCKGSTGGIVCGISRYLKQNNVECLIAYGRGDVPNDVKAIKIGNKFSVALHGLIARFFDKQGFGSLLSTKKLIKQIKKYNPDVIHLHNLHGYYINVRILFEYLKDSKKEIFWTLHDCWPLTGHCCHFDYVGCDKWIHGCYNCKQKKAYPKSVGISNSKFNYKMKKKIFSSIDSDKLTIITPSIWMKDQVGKSYLSKYKIEVINNGINMEIFKHQNNNIKEQFGINNKKIILGVSSVWNTKKGFDSFIELSKIISEEYKMVMIGLEKKQLKNLPSNIIGIQKTENIQELVNWYNAANIYFNSSKEETQGLTTIEAISCGTKAIVYNKTAVPEMVNDKVGYIIEDIDEFMERLGNVGDIDDTSLKEYRKKYSDVSCFEKYYKIMVEKIVSVIKKESN